MVINMNFMVSVFDDLITYGIMRDDRGSECHIFILVTLIIAERRRVDRDLIAQFTVNQRDDFTCKRVAINLKADSIVNFRITADGAGDDLLSHIQFTMVQYVISGDLINRNARLSVQINMHHMVMRYR